MAVIKDSSTNYMKALGLNQAYMLIKLRKYYYIVLLCLIGLITGNIHITAIKKVYTFFLYLDKPNDFRLVLKMILRIFINILVLILKVHY